MLQVVYQLPSGDRCLGYSDGLVPFGWAELYTPAGLKTVGVVLAYTGFRSPARGR